MEEKSIEQKKIKFEKCEVCNKTGWVKTYGFEDGEIKNRLVKLLFPKKKIVCLECIK